MNKMSHNLYHWLGNTVGADRRVGTGLSSLIPVRLRFILLCSKHNAVQDGNKSRKIGTGWMHQEEELGVIHGRDLRSIV
jgi:hypothetical protein